jgi:Beta-galactosidase
MKFAHAGWLLAALLCVGTATAQQTNQLRPWPEYRTIMWIGDSAYKHPEKTALFFKRLREMGINTAMVYDDGNLQPLLDNHFPYYVENIINRGLCLKFNSKVTDWDKFVTGWSREGRSNTALVRDYCLDDPQWRSWAEHQMQRVVRKNMDHEPLAYDIRDELSTTISANPFDYDFSPIALGKFREWLKKEYRDLPALNAEWETKFATWGDVRPFTTDEIKNRMGSGEALPQGKPDWQQVQRLKFDSIAARRAPTRWNFAPWADFRTYMDLALASTLKDLRQAAHEADPRTPVGIEGTQMPNAFGGYDLWRLSQVLEWVEPYDIGNAREIFGSFMPSRAIVTTVFEKDTNQARRRLWHLLLEGDRGCIVWWSEDCIDWNSADYRVTPKAEALRPVLKEMTSPLAKLFLQAERESDNILIHYSQPGIQADWLLESTVDGSRWVRRFSSFEADHNQMAMRRNSWLKAFQDLGYSPRFISSAQIEQGGLRQVSVAVLVLSDSRALSKNEAGEISAFLKNTGNSSQQHLIFWDAAPGQFDEHAKLLPRCAIAEFESSIGDRPSCNVLTALSSKKSKSGDIITYATDRLDTEPSLDWAKWIRENLKPIQPEISAPLSAHVRVHRFRTPHGRLIAFERNVDYHMSEQLKQRGGNEALEKPMQIEAQLKEPAHIYDLRRQEYVGHTNTIHFELNPWQPSLFALTKEKVSLESLGL